MKLYDSDGFSYHCRKTKKPKQKRGFWEWTWIKIDTEQIDVLFNSNYGYAWYFQFNNQWFVTTQTDFGTMAFTTEVRMKVLVEESLLNQASVGLEQSKIYHDALYKIYKEAKTIEEAKAIALNALGYSLDYADLSQDEFEDKE